jgi:L-alanine-DL-glutamate epimerase-like enolase superfamily enzyme
MLDVNCSWSVREALDMTDRLREFKLRWLEEPVWPRPIVTPAFSREVPS